MARKLSLIINRNAEATRGTQSQRTAAAPIPLWLLSKRTRGWSCADRTLEASGSAWEGTWKAGSVLGNSAGMTSQ